MPMMQLAGGDGVAAIVPRPAALPLLRYAALSLLLQSITGWPAAQAHTFTSVDTPPRGDDMPVGVALQGEGGDRPRPTPCAIIQQANAVAGDQGLPPADSKGPVKFLGKLTTCEQCRAACKANSTAADPCRSWAFYYPDSKDTHAGSCYGRHDDVWRPAARLPVAHNHCCSAVSCEHPPSHVPPPRPPPPAPPKLAWSNAAPMLQNSGWNASVRRAPYARLPLAGKAGEWCSPGNGTHAGPH